MKTVAAFTLGCKVNQYESSCILSNFIKNGYHLTSFNSEADVYLINTCTVTNRTDFKSRNAIRKALQRKADNPSVKIIVTGCYSQLNFDKIAEMGDIDLIAANDDKYLISDIIQSAKEYKSNYKSQEIYSESSAEMIADRIRAFIKIQDGCDNYCSYCIIPFARGKPRSRQPQKIIEQVRLLVDAGYKEFVIAGINLGLYGADFNNGSINSLAGILKAIEAIEGVMRVRISSIEPQLINSELLSYIKNSDKLCPHFHIPLQSGCDSTLKSMNRHYDCNFFGNIVDEIISFLPYAAIGTDVIVGFPTETEAEFQETYRFVKSLPAAYAHIFPFSKRPMTAAAKLTSQVDKETVNRRSRMMLELVEAKKEAYRDRLIKDKIMLSSILESKEKGFLTGLSDHYVRIYCSEDSKNIGDYISSEAFAIKADGIEVR